MQSSKPRSSKFKIALVGLLFAAAGGALIMQSNANPNLPGDINNDNVVNISDLSILLSNWGKTGTGTTPNPTPPPPVGTAKYPADITGPNWKITLPVLSGSSAKEIKPPAYNTYSDEFFKLNDAKNGVVFKAYHGGGTTPNSSNPRSELRERYDNDPEGYWNAGSGTHIMEVEGQVNRLTKVRGHVVIAQVHDSEDDTSVWRLERDKLWLTSGNTTNHCLVKDGFKLGERYKLKYEIISGTYNYYFNDQKVSCSYKNSNESYFKAGNYLQSNAGTAPGESTSEFSEVVIYSVKVTHK